MRFLYKYPQAAYPYSRLVEENRRRSRTEPEFELLDTGVFDDDRYFDVFVEYAKKSPEDLLFRSTVCNRGPEDAELHLLPQLWFRDTWSRRSDAKKPELRAEQVPGGVTALVAEHPELGRRVLFCDRKAPLLFTENETNTDRLFGQPNASPYVKDGFHECVIRGRSDAILIATFLRDSSGRRPVYGGAEKFQSDPHFRDHLLFYEYFHGDNGAGIGASHQTGWTGLVARLAQLYHTDSASWLKRR
jgi:hypothetical protein